ncbi:MAG: extracellular solute-binding protein [Clostridium sp.]|uniref:sugar ABC transporter substrate-binding protein n=1 Tax=Clostridium sp. TaxID=1506 RepID=UPI0025BE3C7D|nr:extracellular solute-binding protein [Clostridium sp.]MCF0148020.1 extracellular solute-binding protein [Clostridium sp.]
MKKRLLSLLLAFTATTMLMGCGGKEAKVDESKETNIIIWHQYEQVVEDSIKNSFKDFTSENPNITLTFVKQNDLGQKLTLIGQSEKDAPDVILGPNDWIGKFATMDIINPVSDYIEKSSLDNHNKVTVEAATYNDKLYGIPMTYECLAFMYNKKLLTEVPKNTDDLLKLAKEGTKDDKWGFVSNLTDAYHTMPWIYGFNGEALSKDGVPGLSKAETIEGIEFVKELMKYQPKNVDYSVMDGLFKEGKALAVVNGSWAIKDYSSNANVDLGVEVLPIIKKTNKAAQPFLGVQVALLTESSQNKEAAGKVLNYLAGENVGKAFVETGYLPANEKVDMSSNAYAEKLLEQARLATPMPSSPEMTSVWEPLANALKSISTEENANVKDLMENAQKQTLEKIEASK